MAKYYSSTLQKGSKGTDVTEWQKFLNSQGYNLTVDGDFGDNTYNATVEWQGKNGLGADGIVGDKTWGAAGYTNYSTLSTPTDLPEFDTTPNATLPTPSTMDTTSYKDTTEGQNKHQAVNDAVEAVNGHEGYEFTEYTKGEDVLAAEGAYNDHLANKPGEYSSQWLTQLDALMDQIMNREKFSYDLNGDALYQQYKDNYIQQGKMAMADTMGQAAAMTGGYGNSYAQSVGQQAYQEQLDNLNDIVPELYQMALDKYNMEGQELYNQYGLVMDRENTDYGRYMDIVNAWMTDRDFLAGRVDSALDFDYGKHMDTEDIKHTLNQEEYARLMDALGIAKEDLYHGEEMYYTDLANKNNAEAQKFNELLTLYNVSEEARKYYNSLLQQGYENEEAARLAGLSEYWNQMTWNSASTNGSNSSNGSSSNGSNGGNKGTTPSGVAYDNGSVSDENIKKMQEAIGVGADGYWGPDSTKAAGGLTADEAWAAYEKGELGNKPSNIPAFTGSTYQDAKAFAKEHGLDASSIVGPADWAARRLINRDDPAVAGYNSYYEYLSDMMAYLIETQG